VCSIVWKYSRFGAVSHGFESCHTDHLKISKKEDSMSFNLEQGRARCKAVTERILKSIDFHQLPQLDFEDNVDRNFMRDLELLKHLENKELKNEC